MLVTFKALDSLRLNFSPDSLFVLNLTIAFIMFGVALELKPVHFRNLALNPNIFPPDMAIGGMAFIAAWWGLWHLVAGLVMGGVWSGFRLAPRPAVARS